ncbi:hypothetical protein HID58_044399 [Brassica napus]|uniref:SGNH hydrolase-type esterase domain-containing protein n=1 Tax=Brassica napus TaxID=3708 RepID=A0ABQ8BL25_BRANA|nr:hypothetical protein HID58_044399 [Brassica napus]
MVGPSRPQIVLFGSSIVQMSFGHGGWGAILSEVYARKADIILRGYYGWNSTRAFEVVDKVFPKDAAVQPSLVVVYFGGNDSMGPHPSGLGPHVPLPEYVDNMKKIAFHLQSLSDSTRIIFLSCPPTYSDACVELCKELGLQVVDLFSTLQKVDDWETVCFTDGIHLSAQGSKLVAAEILKVVKEAEWRPSLHWKSMPTEFSEDSPYDLLGEMKVEIHYLVKDSLVTCTIFIYKMWE